MAGEGQEKIEDLHCIEGLNTLQNDDVNEIIIGS